jgi:hypothetical protein
MAAMATAEGRKKQSDSAEIGILKHRESEIREAAEQLVDARTRWSRSDDNFFPQWFEDTISAVLNIILGGDVPKSCHRLHNACVLLAASWEKILTTGEGLRQDGIPDRLFWDLFESVQRQLQTAEAVVNRYLQPVAEQLKEFANDPRKYTYIARNFGWIDQSGDEPTWKGPFFRNGSVIQELIEKEGATPGSIVPPGWHPADEAEKHQTKLVEESGSALARIREHLKNQGKIPAIHNSQSIEDMLLEGQLIGAICRIKGVSEQEVRAIAQQIGVQALSKEEVMRAAELKRDEESKAGRSVSNSPSLADFVEGPGVDVDYLPDDPEHDLDDLADLDSEPVEGDIVASAQETGIASDLVSEAEETADSMLERMFLADNDVTTPEVMSALKNHGLKVSGQWVGRNLASLKRRMSEGVASPVNQ